MIDLSADEVFAEMMAVPADVQKPKPRLTLRCAEHGCRPLGEIFATKEGPVLVTRVTRRTHTGGRYTIGQLLRIGKGEHVASEEVEPEKVVRQPEPAAVFVCDLGNHIELRCPRHGWRRAGSSKDLLGWTLTPPSTGKLLLDSVSSTEGA